MDRIKNFDNKLKTEQSFETFNSKNGNVFKKLIDLIQSWWFFYTEKQ